MDEGKDKNLGLTEESIFRNGGTVFLTVEDQKAWVNKARMRYGSNIEDSFLRGYACEMWVKGLKEWIGKQNNGGSLTIKLQETRSDDPVFPTTSMDLPFLSNKGVALEMLEPEWSDGTKIQKEGFSRIRDGREEELGIRVFKCTFGKKGIFGRQPVR